MFYVIREERTGIRDLSFLRDFETASPPRMLESSIESDLGVRNREP